MTWFDILRDSRYFSTMSCLTNDVVIASLYVITDILIAISMFALGLRVWMKRDGGYLLLPYQCRMLGLIGFLIALGAVMDLVTLFEGFYRLEIMVRGAVAGVSVVLAFTCWTRGGTRDD
jgi:hypothetical protein